MNGSQSKKHTPKNNKHIWSISKLIFVPAESVMFQSPYVHDKRTQVNNKQGDSQLQHLLLRLQPQGGAVSRASNNRTFSSKQIEREKVKNKIK